MESLLSMTSFQGRCVRGYGSERVQEGIYGRTRILDDGREGEDATHAMGMADHEAAGMQSGFVPGSEVPK